MNLNRVTKLFRAAALAALSLSLGGTIAKAASAKAASAKATSVKATTVKAASTKAQDRDHSGSASATVLPGVAAADASADRTKLILELINGAQVVRKFAALELGLTFAYPVPGT